MTQNQLPNDPKAREVFAEAFIRIKIFAVAEILWNRVFTQPERKLLGEDLEAAFNEHGTPGMWVKLHGVTPYRAVLEVARAVNALSETNYRWLLREIGEVADTSHPERPHWNHINGELSYRNKVVRRFRINKNPSNIQRILDAFQAANWTPRIANPLMLGPQQLHQTLRTLKLKHIRFHSLEGGKAIRWEPKSQ